MSRIYHRARKRVAGSPGTVEYTGEHQVERATITVLQYDPDHLEEASPASAEECLRYRDSPIVAWLNVNGLSETATLERFGSHYGLHPLVVEDIGNTQQRPKLEDYEDYLYLVCRMISYDERRDRLESEQVSIVLGRTWVLSFQERDGDVFEPVRSRIRGGKGRIRQRGADYLAYALLDAVVDHYFVVLESFGERIEDLEKDLLERPETGLLERIHGLKREMILLRRAVWPLRDVIAGLERLESELIQDTTMPFLRDVYDHVIQIADIIESYRDMLSGLQDLYLNSLSNRMNEVMKVLTIAATIFVPLTFLAGIYGMNFVHMPELHWKWGYPLFWVVAVAIAGGMLAFFRRKRWL